MDRHLVRSASFLQSDTAPDLPDPEEHRIILVVGGEVELQLPSTTLQAKKGDLILLSSRESCRTRVLKAPYKRYELCVDPEAAEQQLEDGILLSMLRSHPEGFHHCTRVRDLDNFIRIFGNLISEYHSHYRKPYTGQMQQLLVNQLLIRAYRTQNRTALFTTDFPMRDRVLTVQYYIDTNFKTDLKINRICEDMHINPAHFSRMFKAYVGQSPKQYLTNVRLASIQRDLLSTNRSVTDIALDNGFVDVNNFTRVFRKTFGMTPSQYRQSPPVEIK